MDKWRLIVDADLPGVENMARDEVLVMSAESGEAVLPVLRLYGWSEPTISIGYAQDAGLFGAVGLPVVRRITGGRAVLHGDEVTYSVAAPSSHPLFAGGITGTYSVISGCIVAALEDIGIAASLARPAGRGRGGGRSEACFHAPSRSEVLVDGGKLVGSSQRRFKRAFLQHGSILHAIDGAAHEKVFGPGVVERMACVSSFSPVGREGLRAALVKSFSAVLGVYFVEAGFTADERAEAVGLMGGRCSAHGPRAAAPRDGGRLPAR